MLDGIKGIRDFLSVIITVIPFVKKPLNCLIRKLSRILRIKGIFISINLDFETNTFFLEKDKSSLVDYVDWYEKLKRGEQIIVDCPYKLVLRKAIKKEKDENKKKELLGLLETIDKRIDLMALVLEKFLNNEVITYRETTFSTVMRGVIDICFNIQHKRFEYIFEAYQDKKHYFKFNVTEDEYILIKKASKDRILVGYYLTIADLLNYMTDKTLWEYEIIPAYFKQIAMLEQEASKGEIPVENIALWWVSIA